MSKRWLRLVGFLAVGAYLLANSHANVVFAFFGQQNKCDFTHQHETTPGCQHCAAPASEDTDADNCQPEQTCAEGCPGCLPPGHGCPQDGQKCPVPGGCALCNMAKAPCLTLLPIADMTLFPLVGFVCEDPFVYASPCSDGLIRPPRV